MSQTSYHFLPTVRQGLSGWITGPAGSHRASIHVTLRAVAREVAGDQDAYEPEMNVQLYGPGDILGFDSRIVCRTDPAPVCGDYEPNFFPSIEFSDADFAWRYTADLAGSTGLEPWIALIVLVAEEHGGDVWPEFTDGSSTQHALPRFIVIPDASVLPDLQHSWRWAHVHITGEEELDLSGLEAILAAEPERAVCRLLCPRRLRPGTLYSAFVVPTFELGRLSGLGEELPDINALQPAWSKTDTDLKLPYYYRWEFRTGARGDFEHLVRLLEPRVLSGLGIRDVDCRQPGFGVDAVEFDEVSGPERHMLSLEGALKSTDTEFSVWGRDAAEQPDYVLPQTQRDIAALINKPQADLGTSVIPFTAIETAEISDIYVLGLPSGTAVRVVWTTALSVPSHIDYGEDTSYANPASNSQPTENHVLDLKDLMPGVMYHFRIVATPDPDTGLVETTTEGTFQLPLIAVVPPIYGRWHAARTEVDVEDQEPWIDVLNLDPRHRIAAGLGARVVRKQQEALMASAWDQLGAIEGANDVLRRAQFARDSLAGVYERLGQLQTEDFVSVSSRVQGRVLVHDADAGETVTASHYLATRSRIPSAALDPAFRRIARRRGPIRKRQRGARSGDILQRLASGELEPAGPPPKPLGTLRMCDISRRLFRSLAPTASLTAELTDMFPEGQGITLTWSSTNATTRVAGGCWSGSKQASDTETLGPVILDSTGEDVVLMLGDTEISIPGVNQLFFTLTCQGPGGTATAVATVDIGEGGIGLVIPFEPGVVPAPEPEDGSATRFCDGRITCEQILNALEEHRPFEGVQDVPDPDAMAQVVCDVLNDWLDQPPADRDLPPARDVEFITAFAEEVYRQLNPDETLKERAQSRLQLAGELGLRFEEGAEGDPLDSIMWSPEFPQPMYEPLRDISHDLLLPGVERVPQNTISLLETNRRFLESYMCGCNHEFAAELLWREYPTDQRGSYFRQFWDVSEYLLSDTEATQKFIEWLSDNGIATESDFYDLPREAKERILIQDLAITADELMEKWLLDPEVLTSADLSAEQQDLIGQLQSLRSEAVSEIPDEDVDALTRAVIIRIRLRDELRDVQLLKKWGRNALGGNGLGPGDEGRIVLVVRGDLLKRYPNALIYAVDAVESDEGPVPGLREYLPEDAEELLRIYPVFKATLPPDLTFFGFPFSEEDAHGGNGGLGKFMIIEERVGEARFGLDLPGGVTLHATETAGITEIAVVALPTGSGVRMTWHTAEEVPSHVDYGEELPYAESAEDATPKRQHSIDFTDLTPDAIYHFRIVSSTNGGPVEETPDCTFQLDLTPLRTWNDLSWSHFGFAEGDAFGTYLDEAPIPDPAPTEDDNNKPWNGDSTSSATRAWITLQRPVRIAVHAEQMLPEASA